MNSLRATLCMIAFFLLLAYVLPHPVQAETAGMIGLEELQPGMRGTVRSMLQGVKVASFDVQLQGILEGPVAGNKYLLLKVEDDDLRLGSGFSGSPVYFDGRLAGAVSHMEKNLARQMVMAVPIARMMEDTARSGVASLPVQMTAEPLEPGSMIALPLVRGDLWLWSSGTLTYADKQMLLAFGHEHLFSGNTVQVPIHRAVVHGVIPKTDMSYTGDHPCRLCSSPLPPQTFNSYHQTCIPFECYQRTLCKNSPLANRKYWILSAGSVTNTAATILA